MKQLLLITIYFAFSASFALAKDLRSVPNAMALDLSGEVGFDGVQGLDGLNIDCSEFEVAIKGNDGDNGRDGETGSKGEDLFAYLDNTDQLKQLTLNQVGGQGGLGGPAGKGSNGCNGGAPGRDGEIGSVGDVGATGKFYLLSKNFVIPKVKETKILSLTQLDQQNTFLSENTWDTNRGLKSLLGEGSQVRSEYYTFKETKTYEVKLVWNSMQFLTSIEDTRFALSVREGELRLRSYTGGFLEYTIEKTPYGFDVIIHKVIAEHRVHNLKLKRIKYSGIDLTLAVKQRFEPNITVNTRFVISLHRVVNGQTVEKTGFIEISKNLVNKSTDRYFLTIGRLRIPKSFKKKGAKIRIFLTVYREVKNQTRARGLEAIFKI